MTSTDEVPVAPGKWKPSQNFVQESAPGLRGDPAFPAKLRSTLPRSTERETIAQPGPICVGRGPVATPTIS